MSTDKQELGKMATMQRRRNRFVAPMPERPELPPGWPTGGGVTCGKCGATASTAWRRWKSYYPRQGGRFDIFVCAECAVV